MNFLFLFIFQVFLVPSNGASSPAPTDVFLSRPVLPLLSSPPTPPSFDLVLPLPNSSSSFFLRRPSFILHHSSFQHLLYYCTTTTATTKTTVSYLACYVDRCRSFFLRSLVHRCRCRCRCAEPQTASPRCARRPLLTHSLGPVVRPRETNDPIHNQTLLQFLIGIGRVASIVVRVFSIVSTTSLSPWTLSFCQRCIFLLRLQTSSLRYTRNIAVLQHPFFGATEQLAGQDETA